VCHAACQQGQGCNGCDGSCLGPHQSYKCFPDNMCTCSNGSWVPGVCRYDKCAACPGPGQSTSVGLQCHFTQAGCQMAVSLCLNAC
jgi:hypothetical protein